MNGVTRIFANVGQALFAVERRGKYTIVYDCGGESKHVVAYAVPNLLKKGELIDILFISHYDRDHINGIEYLLRHCRVCRIILPMVEEPFRWLQAQTMEEDSFEKIFVKDPIDAIQLYMHKLREEGIDGTTESYVHYIAPWEEYIERNMDPISVSNLPNGAIISAGRPIKLDDTDWIYLPFNRRIMTREQWDLFIWMLGLPAGSKPEDILIHWQTQWYSDTSQKRTIKKAWSEATRIPVGEINNYSMTLYSGPSRILSQSACLFMGDYNAKRFVDVLLEFYDGLWGNVEVIQIPHHGSLDNFNSQIIVHQGIHVISNKQHPTKRGDVNATYAKQMIRLAGEKIVETWQREISFV